MRSTPPRARAPRARAASGPLEEPVRARLRAAEAVPPPVVPPPVVPPPVVVAGRTVVAVVAVVAAGQGEPEAVLSLTAVAQPEAVEPPLALALPELVESLTAVPLPEHTESLTATQVPEATESVVARAPPLVEGPEVWAPAGPASRPITAAAPAMATAMLVLSRICLAPSLG